MVDLPEPALSASASGGCVPRAIVSLPVASRVVRRESAHRPGRCAGSPENMAAAVSLMAGFSMGLLVDGHGGRDAAGIYPTPLPKVWLVSEATGGSRMW